MTKTHSALAALALMAGPAFGHSYDCKDCRPYVIEESCEEDGYGCTARMLYAPGQSMADDPAGSYWYQTPKPHRHHHRSGAVRASRDGNSGDGPEIWPPGRNSAAPGD